MLCFFIYLDILSWYGKSLVKQPKRTKGPQEFEVDFVWFVKWFSHPTANYIPTFWSMATAVHQILVTDRRKHTRHQSNTWGTKKPSELDQRNKNKQIHSLQGGPKH